MKKYNKIGQIIGDRNLTSIIFYQDSIAISYKGSFLRFEQILSTLTAIDISNNAFDGSIHVSVGDLVSLHVLNMSHNALTGEIPFQLGSMTALESLDLSSNIQDYVDGRIPQSHQFATFQDGTFDGNAGLCGPPLSKQCGTPDNPSEAHLESSSHDVDIVLSVFVGMGFGVGFAAAILLNLDWRISRWLHIFRIS